MEYHYILIIFSILFKMSLADYLASDLSFADLPSDVASNLATFTKHGTEIIPGAWVVYIPAGYDVARRIADVEGFQNVYEIPGLNLFHLNDLRPPASEQEEHISIRLTKYEEIKYMAPSRRDKILEHNFGPNDLFCAGPRNTYYKSNAPQFYKDPLYNKQWYLRNCSDLEGEEKQPRYDMGIVQAWSEFKVTGQGIVVISADNGVFAQHLDLKNRISKYFTKNHYNRRDSTDPTPSYSEETHGTRCAGIIVAEANNGVCGVGIAPKATLGAHKFTLKGQQDISYAAETFSYKINEVHIVTSSTGDHEFQAYRPMFSEIYHALETGIKKGRGGKGVIYLFSSGNGKREKETCSSDGQLQVIHKIAVGGAKNTGVASDYAEGCPGVLMVTHSGNGEPYAHITPDLGRPDTCFEDFGGTSAGTPVAAGIVALLLEVNNNLSWRDVKYAIAWTSEIAPLAKNPGWTKNGAGFYVHFDLGFGLMNAYHLVELGKNWPGNAGPMNTCVEGYPIDKAGISFDGSRSKSFKIPTTGCQGTAQEVNYVEHVQLTVTIKHTARGAVQILLTSPQSKNHPTTILPTRRDGSNLPISDFTFLSYHNWGEQPQGDWVVEIMDMTGRGSGHSGVISLLELTIYGTKEQPPLYAKGPRKYLPFSFN